MVSAGAEVNVGSVFRMFEGSGPRHNTPSPTARFRNGPPVNPVHVTKLARSTRNLNVFGKK